PTRRQSASVPPLAPSTGPPTTRPAPSRSACNASSTASRRSSPRLPAEIGRVGVSGGGNEARSVPGLRRGRGAAGQISAGYDLVVWPDGAVRADLDIYGPQRLRERAGSDGRGLQDHRCEAAGEQRSD